MEKTIKEHIDELEEIVTKQSEKLRKLNSQVQELKVQIDKLLREEELDD
jgi:uncharacterized coiled-coil protein SlyX